MGKPVGHTLKDVTINQTNGNIMRHLDLNKNLVEDKSPEVLDKKDSKKKGKLPIKIETVNTLKSSGRAKSARPRFRRNSTAQEPASRQSPPCSSKIKIENCKLEDSPLLQPKQEPAQSSAPETKRVREPELIVMSCLNCYLHVMVCDDNPKCPKCRRGDGLLDMYR
ncbi:hypothetical protein Hanom_Chr12g01103181 [Helianthus anomalus]